MRESEREALKEILNSIYQNLTSLLLLLKKVQSIPISLNYKKWKSLLIIQIL